MATTGVLGAQNRDQGDVSPEDDATARAKAPAKRPGAPANRANHMIRHLKRAVELSYPLYTFSELKRILRCEYHMLIAGLRTQESKTWSELTLLTGMTRAGLNKLGDEVPPRHAHSCIRMLVMILQEAGPEGLSLPKLASRYYEHCPEFEDGPSFEEALRALIDSGEVQEVNNRFAFTAPGDDGEGGGARLVDDIEASVGRIADSVRKEDGFGVAQLHRVSLRVPTDPEAQRKVLSAMREAVCEVAIEAEADCDRLGGESEWLTVVVGGGPDLM